MIRCAYSLRPSGVGCLAVVCLLVLGLSGCRTAPLSGSEGLRSGADRDLPALAAADGTSRLADRRMPEPAERTWVRTKATYERAALHGSCWVRTAEPAKGGGADAGGGEDLAKASQNPIASLISLPFQNNTNFGIGPYDRTQNVLNIQPVIPVSLPRKWSLINRAIIPVIHQPDATSSSGAWDGLGDINLTTFLVAPPQGDWMFGAGPVILFPTASDLHLGDRAWGLGPSAIVVYTHGKWVAGALVNNIWGLEKGGNVGNLEGAVEEKNTLFSQVFVNYNLPKQWYLVFAPVITADWNAPSDQRWVVPVGGGVGKIFKIGKQSFNANVQAYYNVVVPDGGPDWQLRVQLTLLFPTSK